jgi:hypothetical protein
MRQIVTEDRISDEENLMYETLSENGYPRKFIDKYSQPVVPKPVPILAPLKSVFIQLPYKGDDVTALVKRRLTNALQRTFYAAKLVLVQQTTRIPSSPLKDPIELTAKSNLIYGFTCSCGCRYVGRTSRQLGTRISEHVPKWLSTTNCGTPRSAITKHLHETNHQVNLPEAFRVIYIPKSKHKLRFAKAVAIRQINPILCVQKQMVTNLLLPW